MTARDELRTMLDERGVKWRKWDYYGIDIGTIFSTSGIEWIALWNPETNKLSITNYKIDLTPVQAIAATVTQDSFIHESGMNEQTTCHKKWTAGGYGFCSECGYNITGDWAVFCPKCGAKVVDE